LDGSDTTCIYCHLEYLKETHHLEKSRNYLGLAGKVWCPQKTKVFESSNILFSSFFIEMAGYQRKMGRIHEGKSRISPVISPQWDSHRWMDGWMDG